MRPIFGAVISIKTNYWKNRATFATTRTDKTRNTNLSQLLNVLDEKPLSIWPQAKAFSDLINGEGNQAYYYSLGMNSDKHDWLLQSEIAITDSAWTNVALTNGYLNLGRRIGPVTFYAVGSYAKLLRNPKIISSQSSLAEIDTSLTVTENAFNAVLVNQNAVSLGMRWDLSTKMALKALSDHAWVRKKRWRTADFKRAAWP